MLGNFTVEERRRLPELEAAAGEAIETWARLGLNKAATAYNGWRLSDADVDATGGDESLPGPGEVDGPVGGDGIRKTAHGWRKPLR